VIRPQSAAPPIVALEAADSLPFPAHPAQSRPNQHEGGFSMETVVISRAWIKLVLAVIGACGMVWVAQALAQPAGQASAPAASCCVATVDVVRVFNECAQIQDLNQMMKEDTDELAKEAAQRRKVIEDKQIEIGAFKPGTTDFDLRRKDLVRMNIEANVWLKVTEQSMEQDKFDWTRIIYEQTMRAAAEIAREKGFQLVLQSTEFKPQEIEQSIATLRRVIQDRAVLYRAADIDLTDAIIRRLDRDYHAAGGKKQLRKAAPSTGVPRPQP